MRYFTKENITFFIALLGFILSIWDFIEIRIMRACRINAECKNFMTNPNQVENGFIPMFLALSLTNKSSSPITITIINIKINSQTFQFSWIPEIVQTRRKKINNEVIDVDITRCISYPIYIPGHSSVCGYFYVPIDPKFTDDYLIRSSCTLELHTNRGIKYCDITIPRLANDI